jgi:hypothetical protein
MEKTYFVQPRITKTDRDSYIFDYDIEVADDDDFDIQDCEDYDE